LEDEMIVKENIDQSEKPQFIIQPTHGWAFINFPDLWHYRELLYTLIWRDIKIRYKQTVLGVAWVILQPVISTIIFTAIFGILLNAPSNGVPYPVFALSGLLPWTFFASSLNKSSNSLVLNANLITKIYFPRIAVPLSSTLSGLVDFSISFLVLLVVMLFYGIYPTWTILFLPVFLVFAILTALGFGLWLSALNVRYRDVNQLTPFVLQVWMYLTPVVYAVTLIPEQYRFILALNPMTAVVEGFRWSLLGSTIVEGLVSGWLLIVPVFITFFVLVSGAIFFRRTEKTFADII
jgi:lipopolysaccharide transport system permease protein